MPEENFIVREPLLDPKQQVFGYEFFWQQAGINEHAPNDKELSALLAYAGEHLSDTESGWLLGNLLLFVAVSPALLDNAALHSLPPNKTVLIFNASQLDEATGIDILKTARESGFGILLRQVNLRSVNKEWLTFVTHIEVDFANIDISELAKVYGALKQSSSVRMVASRIGSWQAYDACASLGLDAFVGKLHLTPREGYCPKGVNPSQALILKLMDQLKRNADIHDLESLLKRDATLSYKLLRYINSAGFGMKSEIQSLRQAVTMIGYAPLYRWLILLLATSSTDENAAILMQTAIIRGRMIELLAQNSFSKNDLESMFVMGLFSLLDRLLGISMEEALKHIPLTEAATEALLTREGEYGTYLALVEACELRNGLAGALAISLSLQPEQVNRAHMEALAWAQNFTS